MVTGSFEIPYEKQEETTSNRMCGAAALSMVYRSLGKTCSQAEIWSRIGQKDARGGWSARTFRLASDALKQGFPALVLRARRPWPLLRTCTDRAARVILNHRIHRRSPAGHYSVLAGLEEKHALLHDPLLGPARCLTQADLLSLWLPASARSDITGNILVAFSEAPSAETACRQCGTAIPPAIPCQRCENPVVFQPASVIGCIMPHCPERAWEHIFCPHCDARVPGLEMPREAPLTRDQLEALMMDPVANVNSLLESVTQLQAAVDADRLDPLAPEHQEQLTALTTQLKEDQAAFLDAHKEQQEVLAAAQRRVEEEAARYEALQKQVQEEEAQALAAQPQVEAPEIPQVGPDHGQTLRRELLERFGTASEGRQGKKPGETREIWESW